MFMESYENYAHRAAVWTRIHARAPRGGGVEEQELPGARSGSPPRVSQGTLESPLGGGGAPSGAAEAPREGAAADGNHSSSSGGSPFDFGQHRSPKKEKSSPGSGKGSARSCLFAESPNRPSKDDKLREKHKQAKMKGLKRL